MNTYSTALVQYCNEGTNKHNTEYSKAYVSISIHTRTPNKPITSENVICKHINERAFVYVD
jgi:hypothetical protein